MNNVKNLIKSWEKGSAAPSRNKSVTLNITAHDYGKIRALADLYPGYTPEQLASELLSTALDEVEESLPYIPGKKVVAEDEFGDPVYEDAGVTPLFEELARKYANQA